MKHSHLLCWDQVHGNTTHYLLKNCLLTRKGQCFAAGRTGCRQSACRHLHPRAAELHCHQNSTRVHPLSSCSKLYKGQQRCRSVTLNTVQRPERSTSSKGNSHRQTKTIVHSSIGQKLNDWRLAYADVERCSPERASTAFQLPERANPRLTYVTSNYPT